MDRTWSKGQIEAVFTQGRPQPTRISLITSKVEESMLKLPLCLFISKITQKVLTDLIEMQIISQGALIVKQPTMLCNLRLLLPIYVVVRSSLSQCFFSYSEVTLLVFI